MKPCLRYYEVETVLVEIEHALNSRLLTYMSEENYAESITPHHLLYGRDINRKNSDINYLIELSEASDALKQLSNLQQMVSHIKKDSVMNIFSHYVKDIITIVRVIILIFKTFPLMIYSLLSISGTSTGPKKMVPLIECSTYPNCSISGTKKKVPLIELLSYLKSQETEEFTNNQKQAEEEKKMVYRYLCST